jgi:type III secretion protein HrpB1
MTTSSAYDHEAQVLGKEMYGAIDEGRLDEAMSLWEQLSEKVPELKENPTVPVVLTLRSGRAMDAMHLVNTFPEDSWPQLKAMCLHALDDPAWESYARKCEDSSDPFIRKAMQRLLQTAAPA